MVDEQRTQVAVIIGSTRTGRFGPTVAQWVAGLAGQRADLDVDVVGLVEAGLPEVSPADDGSVPSPVRDLAPRLDQADAFVVVTPGAQPQFPPPR